MDNSGTGWILFVIALIVIAYLYFTKDSINIKVNEPGDNTPTSTSQDNNEVSCELTDAYGRTVTITGKSDDPNFQRLCQLQQNQQVYVYGFPYSFIRFNRGGHDGMHGGGHH